jgi:hypothetical protein
LFGCGTLAGAVVDATLRIVSCVVGLDVTDVFVVVLDETAIVGWVVGLDAARVVVVVAAALFDGCVELQPHATSTATLTQVTCFAFMVDSFGSSGMVPLGGSIAV